MGIVQAFAPGRVTGLFSIHEDNDPLHHGSIGAGFCLALGVTTKVSFYEGDQDRFVINDELDRETNVSRAVIHLFYKELGKKKTHYLSVRHQTLLPIGCGFGTSGAGALSLTLALNALYESPLSFFEAAKLAHLAELECGTGLGTVLGETAGGFTVLLAPGAPGVGRVHNFHYPADLRAVFLVLGPLSTTKMLKNPALHKKINHFGGILRQELQGDPNVERFLKLSYQFSLQVGLMSPRLKEIQASLARQKIICPMLMFGDGLYTLVPEHEVSQTVGAFYALQGNGNVFTSGFDLEGGRILDVR